MDAEELAGGAAVSFGSPDSTSNDGFFEDLDRFLQKEPSFEQVVHELFKCLLHRESLKLQNRAAGVYLFAAYSPRCFSPGRSVCGSHPSARAEQARRTDGPCQLRKERSANALWHW